MKLWPPSEWSIWKRVHGIFDYKPPSLYELRPFTRPIAELPPGAIMLFSSSKPSLLQKLIQGVTEARVCHAGIYVGNGNHEIIEADPEGVRKNSLDKRLDDKSVMIWVYVYKPMTVQQLQVLKAYCYGAIGKPYDYITLVDFVLGGGHSSDSMTICSELDVRAYGEIGIQISYKKPDKTAPGDIQAFINDQLKMLPSHWECWDTQNVKTA
jgi:hypothetical protein